MAYVVIGGLIILSGVCFYKAFAKTTKRNSTEDTH
jgi:hypothetical protein